MYVIDGRVSYRKYWQDKIVLSAQNMANLARGRRFCRPDIRYAG